MGVVHIREKCGVFGVYGTTPDAARTTYYGLFALQHRGQEGSGIAASNGQRLRVHKGLGLVTHVYNEDALMKLNGAHLAIGQNRYGTFNAGEDPACYVQPVIENDEFALAHNGNIPQVRRLTEFLHERGEQISGKNDSQLIYSVLHYYLKRGASVPEALYASMPLFPGAYSLLMMTKDALYAVRDEHGIRPLSLGTYHDGTYVLSSETCAVDTVQASMVRDVQPGELIEITKHGLQSYQLREAKPHLDMFEYVYFSRPESYLYGKRVNEVRREFGRRLGKLLDQDVDIVLPVPDSSVPAAEGVAEVMEVPHRNAFIKNRYIGRTFITPGVHLRDATARMKYNLISELVDGKRVVLVDDSAVRFNTLPRLVRMLSDAGARAVHVAIPSAPVIFPDFFGIDLAEQKELPAAWEDNVQLCRRIGATSLTYLPYQEMIDAVGVTEQCLYTGCFSGEYPIDIGDLKNTLRYDVKNIPQK